VCILECERVEVYIRILSGFVELLRGWYCSECRVVGPGHLSDKYSGDGYC